MTYPPYNKDLHNELYKRGGFFEDDNEFIDTPYCQFILKIREHLRRHAKRAEKELYNIRPRPIYVGVVYDPSLNAFAWSTPPKSLEPFDFIGINVGAIHTLFLIFNRMLSHSKIFPDVGCGSMEKDERSALHYLTPNVVFANFEMVEPIDSVRRHFSVILMKIAIDFLFWHELCHLRHGHTDFLQANYKTPLISEAIEEGDKNIDPLTMRTLEMDADSYGIFQTMLSLMRMKGILEIPQQTPKCPSIIALECALKDQGTLIKLVWFSVYTLFRLMGDIEFNPTLEHIKHPQPPMRQFYILATIYEYLKERPELFGYNCDEFSKESGAVVHDVETAISLITQDSLNGKAIASVVRSKENIKYLASLKERWSEIRPELEKYKRGGNLPI